MIALTVVAVAAVATLLLVGLDLLLASRPGRRAAPLDTEQQERWLVRHAPARLRPALRVVDRRVAGGAVVAVSFVVVFGGALIVGWVADSIDRNDGFARWDRSAAEWGAAHAASSSDVLEAITELGSTGPLLVMMAVVGLAMVRRRGWGPAGYLALVGIGVSALNNGLKALVDRERPDIGRLSSFAGPSFPSGHSAAAAACWAALALVVLSRSSRGVRAVGAVTAVFVAAAVAATRVLLGVHWLTDVIAGVVVGWTWFFLCTLVFGGRLLRFGEPADRIARDDERPAPVEGGLVDPEPVETAPTRPDTPVHEEPIPS